MNRFNDKKINIPRIIKSLLTFDKRKKFIISVFILSLFLLVGEFLFTRAAIFIAMSLGMLTNILFYISMHTSGEKSIMPQSFILPFLCSFAFSLFYFLAPQRMLTRVIITTVYASSLYALFLSENIFTVVASKTSIALLNGARIVSFVLTVITYFFLTNIIFSFHIGLGGTISLLFICSFFFMMHSFWSYNLEKSLKKDLVWVITLSVCLCELGFILWFWPTSPTIAAIFLTGILYILTGLSHAWLDKRLFRGVFMEYGWVLLAAFIILIVLTNWQGS